MLKETLSYHLGSCEVAVNENLVSTDIISCMFALTLLIEFSTSVRFSCVGNGSIIIMARWCCDEPREGSRDSVTS